MSTALVKWASDQAAMTVGSATVQKGRRAAEVLRGLIITSEDAAQEVAARLKEVREGRKALKTLETQPDHGPLWFLERARQAVRAVTGPVYELLDAAEAHGKAAYERWYLEQKRRAEEQARKEREEAERAHQAALEEAEITGEDPGPPLEVAATEVPKATRSAGAGSPMVTIQRVLCCKLVDPAACPATLLELRTRDAQAAFKGAVAAGTVQVGAAFLEGAQRLTYQGVEYWYEQRAVGR